MDAMRYGRHVAFVLAVVLTTGSATTAAADWNPPFSITDGGTTATTQEVEPDVALDGNGNAVITWRRSDGSKPRGEARIRLVTGELRPVHTLDADDGGGLFVPTFSPRSRQGQDLAGDGDISPRVAVGATGDFVFVWAARAAPGQRARIYMRTLSAADTLGAIQVLSSPDAVIAQMPLVAVDAAGNAYVTWMENALDGIWRIKTRAHSSGGSLTAIQTLGNGVFPRMAVDESGNAFFAWLYDNGTDWQLRARSRSTDGSLSTVRTLSPSGADAYYPRVTVDAAGTAAFAWASHQGAGVWRVLARKWSAAGVVGARKTVYRDDSSGAGVFDVRAGSDGAGNTVLGWTSDGTSYLRVRTRIWEAGGSLTPTQSLAERRPRANGSAIQIGVHPDGTAVFAWQRDSEPGRPNCCPSWLETRTRSAAGELSAIRTLRFYDPGGELTYRIAVAGTRAIIVYTTNDHRIVGRVSP